MIMFFGDGFESSGFFLLHSPRVSLVFGVDRLSSLSKIYRNYSLAQTTKKKRIVR
jgi:hypothetical protein